MRASELLTQRLEDNSSVTVGPAGSPVDVTIEDGNGPDKLWRVTRFLRLVEDRVGKAIQEGEGLLVRFGEEFDFSRDQTLLKVRGDDLGTYLTIDTGNVVGWVRARCDHYDFRLRVTARFGDGFLRHMIASAEGYLELEDMGAVPEGGDAEWLLIYLWKTRLKQAFTTGVPKLYVGKTERLPLVRGNLDLSAYLRLPADVGRYTCRFRQHSFDNEITRLVNATFRNVSKRDGGVGALLADTHRIRGAFLEASQDREMGGGRRKSRRIRNPFFSRYEQVTELSHKILANESGQLGTNDEEFSSLLFDVSLLFEHYVRQLLINAGLRLAPRIKADAIKYPTGDGFRRLWPDIVVHGRRGSLILDVKFKRWERWIKSDERSRADLFQIMSYAAAYKHKYEDSCPVFGYGFIFPIRSGDREDIEDYFKELGMQYHIFFLRVPDYDPNEDLFEKIIAQSETRLVSNIKQTVRWSRKGDEVFAIPPVQ
jgi:5-methylcytosine-specific restriction enzyme subunit McrC